MESCLEILVDKYEFLLERHCNAADLKLAVHLFCQPIIIFRKEPSQIPPSNSTAFQYNTILITYSLLMIWNDATNEIWVCISQGGHQFCQLFFVKLTDSSEHSSLGSSSKLSVGHRSRSHSNDFSCETLKNVLGLTTTN